MSDNKLRTVLLELALVCITIVTTLAQENQIETYRLLNNTIPLHYDISLDTDIDKAEFEYFGKVTIQILVTSSTKLIRLHNRELNIENVVITCEYEDCDSEGIQVASFINYPIYDFLDITTVDELNEDWEYQITIGFNGTLREINQGFYRSYYNDDDGRERWLATTQFESTNARYAFPCYDEPGLKATFRLEIQHSKDYTAISNMPVDEEASQTIGPDYVVTVFETTPNMSTYLLAFVVSDFESRPSIDPDTNFVHRVFARPNAIELVDFALDEGVKILKALEKYLDMPFTLPKMDQIAIPDFQPGAMENWGLVTYKEAYLLYNSLKGTTKQKQSIISTIAHEYAHQWFGDLVSPKWWTYIWLNEGFATLFEAYASHLVHPEMGFIDDFVIDNLQKAMVDDAMASTRPMSQYADTPLGISSLFDNIAYAKSGSVLRMIQHSFTEKVFAEGLKSYLEAKGHDVAIDTDLYDALHRVLMQDQTEFLDSWTLQAGYPVIKVDRNYENKLMELRQSRFMYEPITETSKIYWWIPFNFVTSKSNNFDITTPDDWMRGIEKLEVPVDADMPDWVIMNKQQTGYYRVNYDQKNWELLIKELMEGDMDRIHRINRAQLVDDSFNLARAGLLDYDIPLSLVLYLKNEMDHTPWYAADVNFRYLHKMFKGTTKYVTLRDFLREIVDEFYKNFINDEEDSTFVKNNRRLAMYWACTLQNSNCLALAESEFSNYLEENKIVVPDLKEYIICHGIRKENWRRVMNRLQGSDDQSDRAILIDGMGCVNDRVALDELLMTTIQTDSSVNYRRAERNNIFNSVLKNAEYGLDVTSVFIRDHYSEMRTLYNGNRTLQTCIMSMAGQITTTKQAESFTRMVLIPLVFEVGTSVTDAANAVIMETLKWQETNGEKIYNWITKYQNNGAPTINHASLKACAISIALSMVFWKQICH